MASRAYYLLLPFLATFFGFAVTAHAASAAASVVDPGDGSLDVARSLYEALTGGHYAWVGALTLVAAVALLRKFGGSRFPQLHTDAGAALLTLGGSFGAAMSAAFAGGGHVSWTMVAAAGATAFAAMGGYAALKKLVVDPYLIPWQAKAPAALKPLLAIVIFWFQHKSDQASAQPTSTAPAPAAPTVH